MNPCEECALRLFNKKHHNLNGVGNIAYGNIIVVPNVDYDAYKAGDMSFSKQVEIIQDVISSTGDLDILDYIYIVPLIRCNINLGCQINDDILKRCSQYLINEINKLVYFKLLCLGDAARIILKCNPGEYLNYLMIDKRQTDNINFYNVNYSPLIKYINKEYYEQFKNYLIKWYNFVVHNHITFDKAIEV